jgi:hypothetical protein
MECRWLRWAAGFGMACVLLTGCDKLPFGRTAANTELDDEFADLDAEPKGTGSDLGAGSSPAPGDLAVNPQEFALKLEVGQRFPLVKAVEQRLTQQLSSGPVVGHSRLELTMSLQVEEVRGPQRRLAVRYHRMRFAQDLGGQYVEYDTANPVGTIPAAAMVYSGLKDNGFSFWLGPDNRVGELIGFAEFVQRCVSGLPAEQRPQAFQQLQSLRGDDSLANFVDDSIGLLPNPADPQFAGQPLRAGAVWQRPATNGSTSDGVRCLLKDLSPQSAEISLIGSIAPAIYVDPVHQLKLTVRSGQLTGTCVVDRTSGMPTQSRIERSLDMIAQLPDGTEIPQRKEVLTTVTAFLDQPGSAPKATYAAPATGVQPAAYQPATTSGPAWGTQSAQGVRQSGYP